MGASGTFGAVLLIQEVFYILRSGARNSLSWIKREINGEQSYDEKSCSCEAFPVSVDHVPAATSAKDNGLAHAPEIRTVIK